MARKRREGRSVVEQLREAISKSGLSANELSRRSGVAVPQITRFMQAKRTITLDTADKICQALHLELTSREEAGK